MNTSVFDPNGVPQRPAVVILWNRVVNQFTARFKYIFSTYIRQKLYLDNGADVREINAPSNGWINISLIDALLTLMDKDTAILSSRRKFDHRKELEEAIRKTFVEASSLSTQTDVFFRNDAKVDFEFSDSPWTDWSLLRKSIESSRTSGKEIVVYKFHTVIESFHEKILGVGGLISIIRLVVESVLVATTDEQLFKLVSANSISLEPEGTSKEDSVSEDDSEVERFDRESKKSVHESVVSNIMRRIDSIGTISYFAFT